MAGPIGCSCQPPSWCAMPGSRAQRRSLLAALTAGALGLALALLAQVAAPRPAPAAEFLDVATIVERLTPANEDEKLRSLAVLPSVDLDIKFEFASARLSPEAARQLDA